MNTPKTRKRNQLLERFNASHLDDKIPAGALRMGCHNTEVSQAYSHAMTYWAFVEDGMATMLQSLLGGAEHEIASTILHTLIAQNSRIPIMRALLENTRTNKDKPHLYDEIIEEFERLNSQRNAYAHGYWYTHEPSEVVYLCGSKLDAMAAIKISGEKITSAELVKFELDCVDLTDRVYTECF